MNKKYLAKIIATDNEGLQMISACCSGGKVKISDIKFLKSNKIFLLSIERSKVESDQINQKVNSICKFDYIDQVNLSFIKKFSTLTTQSDLIKCYLLGKYGGIYTDITNY